MKRMITLEEYEKRMMKIFQQKKQVHEILIEAMEEASKYDIIKLDNLEETLTK